MVSSFLCKNPNLRPLRLAETDLQQVKNARPYRVVVHGLPHFCTKLSRLLRCEGWDVHYHTGQSMASLVALANDLRRCDLAYTWGGRISMGKFLRAAHALGKKNVVMLWSGSDVFFAQKEFAAGRMEPWIASKTHWAVSPWIAEEVRALGLPCEFVQASFVDLAAQVVPLPEKFSVLSYLPNKEKSMLYGWDQIQEVARALPTVEFNVIGLAKGETMDAPPNVTLRGWAEDLTPHLQRATLLWRPVQHDGLSFMVLEALAQGRHVLYSYPFPGCIEVKRAVAAQRELERLLALHRSQVLPTNDAGIRSIAKDFTPAVVRATLLRRWEEIILQSRVSPAPSRVARETRDAAEQVSR